MELKLPEEHRQGFKDLNHFLKEGYAADIADWLMELEEEQREAALDRIDIEKMAEIASYLDYETSYYIAKYYDDRLLSEILSLMHADDAVDFLGTMPVGKVKQILRHMKSNQAAQLQRLLGYDEESAGGLMNTEYVAFYMDNTASQVLRKLRELNIEPEMIYYIYVISRNKELMGVISVRQLLSIESETQLEEFMNEDVIRVEINMDQEEVAQILSKYDLLAVPVVNKRGQLMGIITFDDAMDVLEEEATEDMYKMAATADVYNVKGGLWAIIKKRIPWLLILLVGDLISGSVIKNFEASLQAVVALAFFIPVLMDMGGNVGTQSLTIVVRGLSTGDLEFSDFWNHLWREIKVGLILALIIGAAITSIAYVWQGNPMIGMIVGMSMFSTLLMAVLVGTSIPFIMESLGADPAVASGPFITTIVDISGLFIYFTMATILLKNLL